jgi:transcription termination/antitermination protein NusG
MSTPEERGADDMDRDRIRDEELPGSPVSESDAPLDRPAPTHPDDDERLHNEDAFREERVRAEADDTIDNPGLAEVSEAQDEAGMTPLVDVSYAPNADASAEEAAMHVAPAEPLDTDVESGAFDGTRVGAGTVDEDGGGAGAGIDGVDDADLADVDVDELVGDDAAPVSEFEGGTESEGAGRDEDVVATDYDPSADDDVIEVPLADAQADPDVATDGSGASTATADADDEIAEPEAEPEREPAPEPKPEPAPEPQASTPAPAAEPDGQPETAVADPYKGPGDWYVVHTYAGYENKVKTNLSSRIHTMQMEDKIFDVHIPMEDVMEIKGGKKQVVQKKVFPGYLLVKMIYDNDSWYVVRNTPGVTGFVAAGTGSKPTPLSRREVEKILSVKKQEVKPAFRLGFEERDVVRIISGPFADFNGTITEINLDQSKLKVLVNIFDRETPVELGFDQVAKV